MVTEDIRAALGNDYAAMTVAFRHMDREGHGDLTGAEFRKGLRSLTGKRLSKAQLDDLMRELDRNGDDRVSYTEFIAAFRRTDGARRLAREVKADLRRSIGTHRTSLLRAFDRMDKNRDGVLTAREFQRGLRERGIVLSDAEMKQLMRVVDADGDETLDYVEFMDAVLEEDSNDSAGLEDEEDYESDDYSDEFYSDEEDYRRPRRRGSGSRHGLRSSPRSRASSSPPRSRSWSRGGSSHGNLRLSPRDADRSGRWIGRSSTIV